MNRAQWFVLAQFVLFGIFGFAWLVIPSSASTLFRVLGVVGMIAAMIVLAAAVIEHQIRNRALPNVAPTPQAQAELIESGIYKRIRHPIYTAVLLGALGAALFHGGGVLFALWGVFIVFFTAKSMFEESLLRQAYPGYPAYIGRTGRFLPFL